VLARHVAPTTKRGRAFLCCFCAGPAHTHRHGGRNKSDKLSDPRWAKARVRHQSHVTTPVTAAVGRIAGSGGRDVAQPWHLVSIRQHFFAATMTGRRWAGSDSDLHTDGSLENVAHEAGAAVWSSGSAVWGGARLSGQQRSEPAAQQTYTSLAFPVLNHRRRRWGAKWLIGHVTARVGSSFFTVTQSVTW